MRRVLLLVMLAGCARRLPPLAAPGDAARANVPLVELERGRKLLIQKCGSRCHQTPLPQVHTAAEWPTMLDEMAPRANLDPPERVAIERYLITMSDPAK
jgi:hypothetical protein